VIIRRTPGQFGMNIAHFVFEKIEEFGIDIPEDLKYYPYRAAYDIEVMLEPTDRPKSNKMEWTSTHVLLNISICSNIPDNDRPISFLQIILDIFLAITVEPF
jgi:hypothetical protein